MAALSGLLSCSLVSAQPESDTFMYYPASTGSDSIYNPLHSFLSYSLDTVQIPENFGIDNLNDDLKAVWYQLQHPKQAIEEGGGLKRFINREIFPVDFNHRQESLAMVPNYTLHLLGGGLAFRKDLEWFKAHDYPRPALLAAAWSMGAEILQEAVEQKSTIAIDPIADVYFFRPLGILLFSNDRIAQFIQRTLQPSIWPMLHAWDIRNRQFLNTGISYVYRPPALRFGNSQAFIYTGLTSLVGLSHTVKSIGSFSWGIGAAVRKIASQEKARADLKPSIGIFHDRNNSLQWSAIYNDAGNTRFRFNLYPLDQTFPGCAGWFLSVSESGDLAAGVSIHLPFGIGAS